MFFTDNFLLYISASKIYHAISINTNKNAVFYSKIIAILSQSRMVKDFIGLLRIINTKLIVSR